MTVTPWDDRLTGDVWWCVCCGCKGDLDWGISFILLLWCRFSWGGVIRPCNGDCDILLCVRMLLLRHGVRQFASLVFLLRPPPPPPIFSALWCQRVCRTAVKANATQAPDRISASHEHTLTYFISPQPCPPPPHPFLILISSLPSWVGPVQEVYIWSGSVDQ